MSEKVAHFEIYGVVPQSGKLVTVRKARGPYIGWLDLPGGSPERGEPQLETLSREHCFECE